MIRFRELQMRNFTTGRKVIVTYFHIEPYGRENAENNLCVHNTEKRRFACMCVGGYQLVANW